jgi:hypothetical protein
MQVDVGGYDLDAQTKGPNQKLAILNRSGAVCTAIWRVRRQGNEGKICRSTCIIVSILFAILL